jgi:molybdopterin-containing oxidoreductase family iron-sulfur binding subunit
MRYGMVINLVKCIACYGCTVRCIEEHMLPPGMLWNRVMVSETSTADKAIKHMYPVLCNHCQDPVCVEACPTGATQQREDGIVSVDPDKCAGCRSCLVSCPYQARSFYEKEEEWFPGQGLCEWEKIRKKVYPLQTGVVYKCNFCRERIEEGAKKGLKPGIDLEATPACVIACPAKARYFGDLDDPDTEVSRLIIARKAVQLHPEHGTNPSVYYIVG